jgi:cytochrome c-type biogenesis protein CcsB
VIYPAVFNLALIGYVCATGLALAYLIQREELVYRLAAAATVAGWACHSVALVVRGLELGRPPLASLAEAVSVAVWVVVLAEMWVERQYGVKVLGAFVLPVALVLSLSALSEPLQLPSMGRALTSAWMWVHIALALVGIAAFVLNFAGALMYLLQERQLKGKRQGTFYYRLPALQTLDRLTYRTLALGFPFLTTGLILGAVWAGAAWGSVFAFDPLAILSFLAWAIYAATLAGRSAAGWRGRRAAVFSIIGFTALALTLGAGLFLPGKHGS